MVAWPYWAWDSTAVISEHVVEEARAFHGGSDAEGGEKGLEPECPLQGHRPVS